MSLLAQMAGALVATGLITLAFLAAMRGWDGGVRKLVLASVMSWLTCSFIGGIGAADGGAFAGVYAASMYGPPQLVVLATMLIGHYRRRRPAAPAQKRQEPTL